MPVLDTKIWYGETNENGKWYSLGEGQKMGREAPGKEGNIKGKRIKGRKQKQINYLFFKKPMATRL